MGETHFEPFLHLVDVSHDQALLAWGGFYFTRSGPHEQWRIVDDEELNRFAPERGNSIGAGAESYGVGVVEAYDEHGDLAARSEAPDNNHAWLQGLAPDTTYTYRVLVDGQPWAEDECWDWAPAARGGLDLGPRGRSYQRRFRTHPAPDVPAPLRFAVLGDFGVGATNDTEPGRRQRRIAAVLDRLVAEHGVRLVLTVGDNVYGLRTIETAETIGDEDDDWYACFYAPYRYVINQVPVYPAVGNHDTTETEQSDDRDELADNFHINARFAALDEEARATVSPGLNYRFGYGADIEFCCIDTTETRGGVRGEHYFQYPEHRDFLHRAFPDGSAFPDVSRLRWRIPFFHHPPYSAGPHHANNPVMLDHLLPLFRRSGVRVTFAGHEHNFQVSRVDGLTHLVSGAGGKLLEQAPQGYHDAGTEAWGVQAHCLFVEIDGDRMDITPIAGAGPDGMEVMSALSPGGDPVYPPFTVTSVS